MTPRLTASQPQSTRCPSTSTPVPPGVRSFLEPLRVGIIGDFMSPLSAKSWPGEYPRSPNQVNADPARFPKRVPQNRPPHRTSAPAEPRRPSSDCKWNWQSFYGGNTFALPISVSGSNRNAPWGLRPEQKSGGARGSALPPALPAVTVMQAAQPATRKDRQSKGMPFSDDNDTGAPRR